MNATPPRRNEPDLGASRGEPKRDNEGPVGVDEQTAEADLAKYGALIANAEDVVDRNINTPLTVSRFGFINAMLRTFFRRSGE